MSAKLLMALSEEKPELEKQIGCMTGIFQVFDPHHLLTLRRLSGSNHKRISSGHPRSSDTTYKEEQSSTSPQIVLEYNPNKNLNSTRRLSVESSNERNKETKPKNSNTDTKGSRDVVKDSINGEKTQVLSIKTSVKEEAMKKDTLKHKDSPRPIMSVDLNDSLRVLVRLNETPLNSYVSEVPRFSCDGREFSRSKSSTKLRELPRLSLDSREIPLQNSNSSSRIPSVVAKLMGLEPMELMNANGKITSDPLCENGEKDEKNHFIHSPRPTSKQNESVYSQIEKRVQDLDFWQSNKDLRALKHILDKMQAKGLLDDQKNQNSKWVDPSNPFEAPIVIMKPAKAFKSSSDLRKVSLGVKRSEERISEKIQIPHMQRSPRPQKLVRERSENPVKKSNPSSPGVEKRKIEPEKKPRASTRKHNENRKSLETRASTRSLPRREDRKISLSDERSMMMNSVLNQEDNLKVQNDDHSSTDSAINLVEQPSPISVLETSFYPYDLPLSPVKKISCSIADDEIPAILVNDTPTKLRSEMNLQKLSSVNNLIEKLKQLSSIDDSNDPLSQVLNNLISRKPKSNAEKLDDDLMLDLVKEIILQKMNLMMSLGAKKLNGHSLLDEICSEIKLVQNEKPMDDDGLRIHDDLMGKSNGWESFGVEVQGMVLEIERSIFKDLIDEVLIGEAHRGAIAKGSRRRKKLFL